MNVTYKLQGVKKHSTSIIIVSHFHDSKISITIDYLNTALANSHGARSQPERQATPASL